MTDLKTGYFNSFDGSAIYYEVHGQGKPLIFVYGIACLMNQWRHQTSYFSQNYQTILLDLRGHHKSPANEPLTIDALAEDLFSLIKHLGYEQASFWGHSFGVQIILRLFELHPEVIANVVFINGFASHPLKEMFGVSFMDQTYSIVKELYHQYPDKFRLMWKSLIDNPVGNFLLTVAGGFNFHVAPFEDIENYARGVANMNIDVFFKFFDEIIRYDGRPVIEKINVPTLIVSGEKDAVTPKQFQREMHEKIKGSDFFFVPYGTHCTHIDFPEYVNLKIEKFLKSKAHY